MHPLHSRGLFGNGSFAIRVEGQLLVHGIMANSLTD